MEELEVKEEKKELAEFNSNDNLPAFSGGNLQLAWKIANNISKSNIVPKDYQNQPANCLIALDMSTRLNMSPMMVMQNMYVVYGRPSWSGQMVTALINRSRRFKSPLKFMIQGEGDNMSCYAYTEDLEGNIVKGPTVTMLMVKEEGWLNKTGSKWKTMPELMFQYRSASFFGRVHCPDLLMGLYTADEIKDMYATSEVKEEVPNVFEDKGGNE